MEQSFNVCIVDDKDVILYQSIDSNYRIKNIFYPWNDVYELNRILNYLPCWIIKFDTFYINNKYLYYDKLPPNLQNLNMSATNINLNNLPLLLNILIMYDCLGKNIKNKYYNLPNNLEYMVIKCMCYKIHNYAIHFMETTLKRIKLILINTYNGFNMDALVNDYKLQFDTNDIKLKQSYLYNYFEITKKT